MKTFTFTKLTMCIIFILFIIGSLIGGVLVVISAIHDITLGLQIDTGMYIAYAAYLGTPAATSIGFYAWKSKAENIVKIQQNLPKDRNVEEIASALASMRGGE